MWSYKEVIELYWFSHINKERDPCEVCSIDCYKTYGPWNTAPVKVFPQKWSHKRKIWFYEYWSEHLFGLACEDIKLHGKMKKDWQEPTVLVKVQRRRPFGWLKMTTRRIWGRIISNISYPVLLPTFIPLIKHTKKISHWPSFMLFMFFKNKAIDSTSPKGNRSLKKSLRP